MLARAIGKRRGGADAVNYAFAVDALARVVDAFEVRFHREDAAVRQFEIVESGLERCRLVDQPQTHAADFQQQAAQNDALRNGAVRRA